MENGNGKVVAINLDNILYYCPVDEKTTSIYLASMNIDLPVIIPVKGKFDDIDALLNRTE